MATLPLPAAIAPTQPPGGRPIEPHRIGFTGAGSEYFGVWFVNLLLTIVTLSLYTPWARRRTAQYFYGHTQVVGSPLEFVAEARRMAFGFLVFAALYVAYELALQTGQDLAASLLFFGFAALLPLLWGSAMRFRLGATRWRGIRPTVRGIAMNPVDHPMGGGEGRSKSGRQPVDPWGNLTKGYRTRSNKRTQNMIVSRRKK